MTSLFAFLTSHLCPVNTNVGPTDAHLHLIAAKYCLQGQRRVNALPFRSERGGSSTLQGTPGRALARCAGGLTAAPDL